MATDYSDSLVVISIRDKDGYYIPIVVADTEGQAQSWLATFRKTNVTNDYWTESEMVSEVPYLHEPAGVGN